MQDTDDRFLKAALKYASKMKWPVFPCNGKKPLTPNGFKDASTEPDQIREWWEKHPDANIGIPTGSESLIDVLDIDPRNGGDGSLEDLESKHSKLPDTVEQLTGGGGRHLLFKHQEGLRCAVDLRPGLDLRAEGGYFVAAPSVHPSGRRYEWELSSRPGEAEIADYPAWLLSLLKQDNNKLTNDGIGDVIPQGKRNDTLARIAGVMRRPGMTKEAIAAALLVENKTRCKPPLPDSEVIQIATSIGKCLPSVSVGEGSSDTEWQKPQSLPDGLPDVEPFDSHLLPEALRPWIEDIADRMQCPPDFPAVGAMVGLSSVIGRQIGILPKKNDDWVVVPNLWGGVVGRSGVLKSPALREPLRPLDQLEATSRQRYEEELALHEADTLVADAQRKFAKDEVRRVIKNKNSNPREVALAALGESPDPPKRRRYVVNDTTVEKLGEILNANPRGCLLFRDELVGFLKTLDKDGREGDRAFYLESWNGDGTYSYDRIGRGTIFIEAACVSILGGIQPGPLASYVAKSARGGTDDDGLLQRFQLLVWPDISGEWRNEDVCPNQAARANAFSVYHCLDKIDADHIGARDHGSVPCLRFEPAAQDVFDEFRGELEIRLRNEEEHPMMESHLAKYRSLVPSLALAIHLADNLVGPVSIDALGRACAWAEYLESHARRVYSPALSPGAVVAKVVAQHVLKGDLGTEFAPRDVQRKNWRGIVDLDEIKQGLEFLEDLDWLRSNRMATPGRTAFRYLVNPRITEVKEKWVSG